MKANPQIKLYKYDNSAFILIAIIDDYQQISFEHSLYSAGTFTVTINYNIPNARLFRRGLFVQFGDNPHDFGEILTMRNSIGPDGKGSEILNITGYDARYLFKRRIIRNLNANDVWTMTAKGEKTYVLDDDWTVVTADNSLSAHFEHTVAITDDGCEVLTLPADYP